MSDILNQFNVLPNNSKDFEHKVKLFHVFNNHLQLKSIFIVTNEDKVFAFGSNYLGQSGFGHSCVVDKLQEIPELSGKLIKQFLIGLNFVLSLNEENRVFSWGQNDQGQLGRGYKSGLGECLKPEIIRELENMIEIGCGFWHSLALNREGNVFSWGDNGFGQVGCGKQSGSCITSPIQLEELPKIKSIHCFGWRSFAVTFDGLVYSWGYNYLYCLGHESRDCIYEPKLIIGLNNIISVNFSQDNTYFLTNEGNIYFCGKIDSCEDSHSDSDIEDDLIRKPKPKRKRIDSRDGKYQKIPKILETNLKFQSLETTDDSKLLCEVMVLRFEESVYCLEGNTIQKTEYKTIFDYFLNEKQVTHKTINDDFEQVCHLGSGGFGKVVKIMNKFSQNIFALKIIRLESNDHSLSKRIERELKAMSDCSENYIVKYYNSWTLNNSVYIKMECCSDNLKNIINKKNECFERNSLKAMTINEYFICSQILKDILECVKYLHELSPPIIHRDLKPENILVNYQPINRRFVKLCDFGLAKFVDDPDMSHTSNLGDIRYVAPEVLNGDSDGKAKYGLESDVYSLGFILCDLFGFDINSDNQIITNNEKLSQKWLELGKQAIRMLETIYSERPTCAQLLKDFKLWGISEMSSTLKKCDEYKENIIKLKQFENQFLYNYFTDKIIHSESDSDEVIDLLKKENHQLKIDIDQYRSDSSRNKLIIYSLLFLNILLFLLFFNIYFYFRKTLEKDSEIADPIQKNDMFGSIGPLKYQDSCLTCIIRCSFLGKYNRNPNGLIID